MNAILASAKTILNSADIKARAPAVFARRASNKVSATYGFIPTEQLVDAFAAEGFMCAGAGGQRAYKGTGNDLYGRHMLWFRQRGTEKELTVNDVIPQVLLYNAHNGRSLYKLYSGLFRVICANGLVVSDKQFGCLEVRHSEGALEQVLAGSKKLLADAKRTIPLVNKMRSTKLSDKQLMAFARNALKLRYKDEAAPITAEALLVPRRPEDAGNSLWLTLNRVQENLLRGGMEGKTGTGRVLHVRKLTNIKREVAVNVDLWDLAAAQMRRAA